MIICDYEKIAAQEEARRLSITVDYVVFFQTAPLSQQWRPQVVIPLNV